jgi:F-type H+-transporting ATPase subunit a
MSLRNRIFLVLGVLLVVGIILYAVGIRSNKLHISVAAEPVACLGGERATLYSCASGFPLTNGLITTVIVDLLLLLTAIFATRNMQLIPRGFQNVVEAVIEAFYNFARGVDRRNVAKFFPFCCSIFLFALFANVFGLLPGVGSIGVCAVENEPGSALVLQGGANKLLAAEEPTTKTWVDSLPGSCADGTTLVPLFRAPSADLNVTIAWGLVAVLLIQVFGVQALGANYFTKFFNFKEGAMGVIIGILELISEFVRIIAFAFRLFGNIFAGEVILVVMAFLFAYILPVPFYLFEVFVAFIQAVIFSVLSLVFMSLATIAHGHDDHGHGATPVEAGDVPGHAGAH